MMARSDGLSTVTDGGNGHNRRSSADADTTGTADHARPLASAIDLGADIEVGRRRLSSWCRHDDREMGRVKSDHCNMYDIPK